MVGRLRRLCGGLVAEAMCWVGCGGYVLGGLRRKIVPTLAQPTGFSHRSERGKYLKNFSKQVFRPKFAKIVHDLRLIRFTRKVYISDFEAKKGSVWTDNLFGVSSVHTQKNHRAYLD